MGESIVETPFVKNKMDDSVRSGPTLEVSVSFGRFDNDALSWEKWSSFSPNKYLEEVEKCATPGSVAQKKAYFEAHYKKIAARKIKQIEQEKQEAEEKMMESTQVPGSDFSSSNGENFSIVEPKVDNTVDVKCDYLSVIDESKEDISVDKECDSLLVTETKEEVLSGIDNSKEVVCVDVECDTSVVTNAKERTILATCDQGELHKVEEQIPAKGCQDSPTETPQVKNKVQKSSIKKTKNSNTNVKNAPQKVHTTGDRLSAGPKKKLASPVTKSSGISTPASKPASTTKLISPSQPSAKKANGVPTQKSSNTPLAQRKKVVPGSLVTPSQSANKKLSGASLQRSENSPVIVNKRVAPTSLHMSLSLSSPNSIASTTTMRKSLIMESMGDKDIVKRAFRAFQSSYSQGQQQVAPKVSELKIPNSATLKESERSRKTPDNVTTLKGQPGSRSTSLSSGAPKVVGSEKKKVSSIGASTGSRIDRSAGKWKEEISKAKIKRPGSNR